MGAKKRCRISRKAIHAIRLEMAPSAVEGMLQGAHPERLSMVAARAWRKSGGRSAPKDRSRRVARRRLICDNEETAGIVLFGDVSCQQRSEPALLLPQSQVTVAQIALHTGKQETAQPAVGHSLVALEQLPSTPDIRAVLPQALRSVIVGKPAVPHLLRDGRRPRHRLLAFDRWSRNRNCKAVAQQVALLELISMKAHPINRYRRLFADTRRRRLQKVVVYVADQQTERLCRPRMLVLHARKTDRPVRQVERLGQPSLHFSGRQFLFGYVDIEMLARAARFV